MRDLVEIALDRFREKQHSQITKERFSSWLKWVFLFVGSAPRGKSTLPNNKRKFLQLAQMGGSSKIKSEPPIRSCLIQAGASLSSDLAPLACVCDQHSQIKRGLYFSKPVPRHSGWDPSWNLVARSCLLKGKGGEEGGDGGRGEEESKPAAPE